MCWVQDQCTQTRTDGKMLPSYLTDGDIVVLEYTEGMVYIAKVTQKRFKAVFGKQPIGKINYDNKDFEIEFLDGSLELNPQDIMRIDWRYFISHIPEELFVREGDGRLIPNDRLQSFLCEKLSLYCTNKVF